ncbi:MAG TPA: RNA polymerase sigma factor [Chthonomonas sp.]|uniref:RNA polymerase sigma factor n=1 Tax=Chthonomonas sp. TaxID=2282153 RepID=UPI002B4B161E|nr:RNA polymerase sigma factor [Chthonomonas sp.]HLH81228.1 RNA polymerase sigma factor [Chthonomonas sp.]
MKSGLSEQELAQKCREGNMEAFEELYARCSRAVYRYAYRMLNDADEADDVMQETFVRAFRMLPNFRGECNLLTWLIKIASNLCRDRYKTRMRRREVPFDDQLANRPDNSQRGRDPADLVVQQDLQERVRRVLAALPAAHREVIVLRDFEELSYQEIAQILDCSISSIKLRLFRARRAFRERLESLLKA